MAKVVITNEREWQSLFNSVANDFRNKVRYKRLLQAVLTDLQDQHTSYFDADTGPDGAQWPPLSPYTIQRKWHDTILEDTRRLKRSLTTKRGVDAVRELFQEGFNSGVTFGTEVPYSRFHDKTSGNRPARRHVGTTVRYIDELAGKVADTTIQQLTRAE